MDNDYYSLSSILAENHKLACTFTLDVPGLGYLESETERDLHAGCKAELPLWLGQTLCLNELTTFAVPTPFSSRVRAALNASAPAVRLAGLVGPGGWWYRFGARVAGIWDNGDALLEMLLRALKDRLPPLQDLAAHHASAEVSVVGAGAGAGDAFHDGMEADERDLFLVGQDSGRTMQAWYDSSWGKRGNRG